MGTIYDSRHGGLGMAFASNFGGATVLTGESGGPLSRTAALAAALASDYADYRISYDLRSELSYTAKRAVVIDAVKGLGAVVAKPDTTNFFVASALSLQEVILRLQSVLDSNDVLTVTNLASGDSTIIDQSGIRRIMARR